jgi:hypothetical protein
MGDPEPPMIQSVLVTLAAAHEGGPDLHVGYTHDSCYIDLHSELTDRDFHVFDRQFADAGSFLPMAGARPLGAGHVAVGLTYNQTFLDDATPQWNHTFSHPGGEHYLGSPALPTLQGRVGVGARTDLELMLTGDPQSNWAIAGLAARRVLLVQSDRAPVDVSARATYVHLLGAPELEHDSAAAEVLVSRTFGPFTPYVGAGGVAGLATERTDELDLGSALTFGARGTAGAEVALGPVRLSGQVMLASVPSAAVLVGGAF